MDRKFRYNENCPFSLFYPSDESMQLEGELGRRGWILPAADEGGEAPWINDAYRRSSRHHHKLCELHPTSADGFRRVRWFRPEFLLN
jgi:hypothetical protein